MPEIKNQEVTRRVWIIVGAIIGVTACATHLTDAFSSFLGIISSLVPPLFPIMAIHYWCFKGNRRKYLLEEPPSSVSWGAVLSAVAGIIVALATNHFAIGISALQGTAVSGVLYFIYCKAKGMK